MHPTESERLAGIRHVVHDYANLVSAGTMKLTDTHAGRPLDAPVNTHVGEAFLGSCRKMFEFFMYPRFSSKGKGDDLGAALYLAHLLSPLAFDLSHWASWHDPMNKQLMHVTLARVTKPQRWEGHNENALFLNEFREAWRLLLRNLTNPYAAEFERQITARLQSEYGHLDLR